MSIDKDMLGSAIKLARVARGFTQAQLAEAAGLAKGGKSVALIEQGKRFVSVDTLNALASALDIPPACLAILGSRTIGKNKAATDFMESLQRLISAVLFAEAEMGTKGEKEGRPIRRNAANAERKQLSKLAEAFAARTKPQQARERRKARKQRMTTTR